MKLTKQVCDRATYSGDGGGRCVLWDDEIRGLGLRIYPSNRKSFVLSYRSHGRKHLMALGNFGVITLDEARRLARIKLGEVAQGNDPLIEKRSLAKVGTIGEMCDTYMARHSKIHKKSWQEDDRRIERHIKPALKNIAAPSLTVADAARLHLKLGESSIYEANRTIELLRAIIEKGKIWGFLPLAAPNVAKAIKRFKEEKRDRWLTPDELPRVAAAIAQEDNIYIRAAIWLYLLTGVRKSELLTAKWEDIDFNRCELRLRDTKAGNTHYVPLSTAAMQILSNVPRQDDNPYVIPGQKKGAHLVNVSKPWIRIRKAANVTDVRLHDLRRTVGSWLAQNGMSLHLIGRVLNHASSETTKIYARFGQDNVRDALEQHGTKLISGAIENVSLIANDTKLERRRGQNSSLILGDTEAPHK